MTPLEINAALLSFDIVRRNENPEAQEVLVTYPTGAGFEDAATLVDFIVRCDEENRTVDKVMGWLLEGSKVWTYFGYYRLVPKAPEPTAEELKAPEGPQGPEGSRHFGVTDEEAKAWLWGNLERPQDDRKDLRQLQEGHMAFVRQEGIEQRNASLKAYQDSRNAQVRA